MGRSTTSWARYIHQMQSRPSMYIVDSDLAQQERMGHNKREWEVANEKCDPSLMRKLADLIADISPYAEAYRFMKEVEDEATEEA